MTEEKTRPEGRVLVLGSTGFVGSRLVPLLLKEGVPLRLLVRDPAKVRRLVPEGATWKSSGAT
ncbi:MAG: NmrA family NAD(P)-binding protein [Desulfobacterales bacterium]|nr:NmrA family NAD(P)-binding protein [Desulfobacterales bacterium]